MISLSHITIGGVQTFNDLAWFINYALRIVATICGVHNDKDFLKTYSFQESVSQCNYSWRIKDIPGKSRDQNLKVALSNG